MHPLAWPALCWCRRNPVLATISGLAAWFLLLWAGNEISIYRSGRDLKYQQLMQRAEQYRQHNEPGNATAMLMQARSLWVDERWRGEAIQIFELKYAPRSYAVPVLRATHAVSFRSATGLWQYPLAGRVERR